MRFRSCCADTRKAKPKVADNTDIPTTESLGRTDITSIEYHGRLTAPDLPPQNAQLQGAILQTALEKKMDTSETLCPSNGKRLFFSDSTNYRLGYEPIKGDDVIIQYMTEDEVRLHQLQTERNKLLARTSSEMINDHIGRGRLAGRSSSAELMKRAQSPDE